jgi:type I restriction enzyme S subunit
MNLFKPPDEVLDKDVELAESTPKQLKQTMGASAYTGDYGRAMELVDTTEHEVIELQELCERVFKKPRFKRIYVSDKEYGHPYLAPTDVGSLKPWYRQINNTEKGYISRTKHNLSEYNVEKGWILITRSGSVNLGSVFLTTEFLSNYFLTDDMIRVVPKEETLEGYLYAYLDSWVGRSIMLHNEFGIGVDHIDPGQLEDMPIILLPEEQRESIHEDIIDAYDGRQEFLEKDKSTVEATGDVVEILGENDEELLDNFDL